MNGIVYAITEILAFVVAASGIGFLLGRVTKRTPRHVPGRLSQVVADTELAESRELIASLERKLELAMAAAGDATGADDAMVAELEARLADADATIDELRTANDRLQAGAAGGGDDDPAETSRLQTELEAQQREIERLESILAENAPPTDRKPRKEPAADRRGAGRPAVGWSTGSGGFADTLVEFD